MRKKTRIILLVILILAALLAAVWKPLRLDRFGLPFVQIDWIDVVKWEGVTYESRIKPRVEVPLADIGAKLGQVQFTVYGHVSNSRYQLRNGDATFLDPGTEVFTIKNDPDALAVLLDGKYYRYDQNMRLPTTAESTSQPTATTATSGTTTVTTATTTTIATISPTTTVTTTKAAVPADDFNYRALTANKAHSIDLNGDKVPESISYTSKGDNYAQLTLNGQVTQASGDAFLTGWFFLIDLDARDAYLDVAIQEVGPSNDEWVTFWFYDGSKLIQRGKIYGMICDPNSQSIGQDAFSLGTIRPDGLGGLVTRARGIILHTWFFDEPWVIGSDQSLKRVDQAYYAMVGYDEITNKQLPETPVKMLVDLPLLDKPGSELVVATAKTGQSASLVQTDDREWVQLRTQAGQLGWFKVIDYFQIKIGSKLYNSFEIFDGLSFAD